MSHLYYKTDYISEIVRANLQDHDRIVIPAFLELSIRTTELSNTSNVFVIIVSST